MRVKKDLKLYLTNFTVTIPKESKIVFKKGHLIFSAKIEIKVFQKGDHVYVNFWDYIGEVKNENALLELKNLIKTRRCGYFSTGGFR